MIKVKALEQFTLADFDKLKNLVRADKAKDEYGHIYVGDIFECDEDIVEYLTVSNRFTKENPNRKFVQIIEVIPEESSTKVEIPEEKTEDVPVKPKRTRKTKK